MNGDHYLALGVRPDATHQEIRAAYLRLMRAHHPDRRPGDPTAEATARRANAAWEVLRDSARRAAYDRLQAVRDGGPHDTLGGHVLRDPHAAVSRVVAKRQPAYSAAQAAYRRDFQRACLRVGVATVLLGSLGLLAAG